MKEDNCRVQTFKSLSRLLTKNAKENDKLIIGGDYNIVLNEEIYKKGGIKEQKLKSRNVLKQLIENFNLVDIRRVRNPKSRQYTWRH
jgi:exonuclease III